MAVVADKDPKLCLYALRSYGGERTFCTTVQSAPAYSLAVSTQWVASASEGGGWELASGSFLFIAETIITMNLMNLHELTGYHDFVKIVNNSTSKL